MGSGTLAAIWRLLNLCFNLIYVFWIARWLSPAEGSKIALFAFGPVCIMNCTPYNGLAIQSGWIQTRPHNVGGDGNVREDSRKSCGPVPQEGLW